MYQLILADIESNNLIPSSKYPVKYVELFFVSINIEIISINIPNIYWLFWTLKFLFCYFCLAKSQYYYTIKKITAIIFYLIYTNIHLKELGGSIFCLYEKPGWPVVSDFIEILELYWDFFDTRFVLEKQQFLNKIL